MRTNRIIISIVFFALYCSSGFSQTNWFWQNPLPTGNNLTNIQFTDINTGFAIGDNFSILKTTNSGENWSLKHIDEDSIPSGLNGNLRAIYFQNSSVGYIGGNGIFKTTNGGENWTYQNTGTFVNSIFFTGTDTGFAACNSGKIMMTTNGGNNWVLKFSNGSSYYNYYKIMFISDDTGFVVGDNQVILKTTNKGNNWIFKNVPIVINLYDINFIDKTTGFSSGSYDKIIKTTNGGDNWIAIPTLVEREFNNICFVSRDTGYLVSNYRYEGRIYKTVTGGNSWYLIADLGFRISKFVFLQGDQFFISCDGGNLFKTTDSGISWFNKIKNVSTANLTSVCFVSDQTGFIAGYNNTLLNTTNGGSNWELQNTPGNENYRYVKFFDNENGYLAGSNLYKTSNSGLSWDSLLNLNGFKYVKFFNIDTGYVLLNDFLYKTFNRGTNWTTNHVLNNTSSIYFLKNNDIGFAFDAYTTGIVPAVYYHNDIYKTSNNGVSWELLYPINNGWGTGFYSAITFLNSNTGFMTGYVGIRKTTDGGFTWGSNYQGLTGITSELYFSGQNIGYLYNNYNRMFKTTNSGNNWTQISELSKSISSFYFNDNNTGYIVGQLGCILKTTNGGGIFVNVNESSDKIASSYVLYQNYPNPFNPSTKIEFELPESKFVKLIIYDLIGRELKTLVSENLSSGKHEVNFEGTNLPSGIYFYKLETGTFSQTKKMLLIK